MGTIRAGMTYVTVSLLSSLLFLTAIGDGLRGHGDGEPRRPVRAGRHAAGGACARCSRLMLVVVFGIKAAMVPLHFWLPDSYPNAPAPVTALFAGLLTKVSFYAMVRTQTLLFPHDGPWTLMLWLAVATMLVGALGALAQNDINRLLSFLLVSHIGFMLFGLAVFDARGMSGRHPLRRAPHHGARHAVPGQRSDHAADRHGRAGPDGRAARRRRPALAVLFAIPALTLAGLPPTAGFVAKLQLLQAGAGGRVAATAVAGRRDRREPADALRAGQGLGAGVLGQPAASPSRTPTRTTSWRSAPPGRRGRCTPRRPGWSWSAWRSPCSPGRSRR